MSFAIFGRFHAHEGAEEKLLEAIREVSELSRNEPGCLRLHWYRGKSDSRLFIVCSEWTNEEAFDLHAKLPHTVQFLNSVPELIDHPLEPVTRTETVI